MEYRQLGASDLRVSEISLGSWLTYGVGVERDRAEACVRRAFDLGINFFDTANAYGRGAAESLLGEILEDVPRDSYILATKGFFPMSAANGISQIVWSPLAQGVLTGKYRPGEAPPPDSRATSDEMGGFIGRLLEDDVLEAVQGLRPIADKLGLTMAQLALAWVLREPNVASAIVGASRPEQLDDNAAAAGVRLDDDVLAAIDDAVGAVAH